MSDSTAVFLAELRPLFRKTVLFSTIDGEITGKVLAVDKNGVVVRFKGNPRIITFADIIQHKEVTRPRRKRVVRRIVRPIPRTTSIKQHLVDRHALFMDLAIAVDEGTAHDIHDAISHDNLGHYHKDSADALSDLDGTDDEVDATENEVNDDEQERTD